MSFIISFMRRARSVPAGPVFCPWEVACRLPTRPLGGFIGHYHARVLRVSDFAGKHSSFGKVFVQSRHNSIPRPIIPA
jgi:hypothetical protein